MKLQSNCDVCVFDEESNSTKQHKSFCFDFFSVFNMLVKWIKNNFPTECRRITIIITIHSILSIYFSFAKEIGCSILFDLTSGYNCKKLTVFERIISRYLKKWFTLNINRRVVIKRILASKFEHNYDFEKKFSYFYDFFLQRQFFFFV